MNRFLIALLVALLVAPAALADCKSTTVDASTDAYVRVKESVISISFEPDTAGAGVTATVTMQMCVVENDANTCLDYDYDSNGDGVADTNILDGLTTEKSGVKNVTGFNFLRVTTGTSPGAGEIPKFTVCITKE